MPDPTSAGCLGFGSFFSASDKQTDWAADIRMGGPSSGVWYVQLRSGSAQNGIL